MGGGGGGGVGGGGGGGGGGDSKKKRVKSQTAPRITKSADMRRRYQAKIISGEKTFKLQKRQKRQAGAGDL